MRRTDAFQIRIEPELRELPADLKAPTRQPLAGWEPCRLDDGWGAVRDGPDVAALAEDPRGTPISVTDIGA